MENCENNSRVAHAAKMQREPLSTRIYVYMVEGDGTHNIYKPIQGIRTRNYGLCSFVASRVHSFDCWLSDGFRLFGEVENNYT